MKRIDRSTVKTPIRMIEQGPPSACCGAPMEYWPTVSVRKHALACVGVGQRKQGDVPSAASVSAEMSFKSETSILKALRTRVAGA